MAKLDEIEAAKTCLTESEYWGKKIKRIFELLDKANRLAEGGYSLQFENRHNGVIVFEKRPTLKTITFDSLLSCESKLKDEIISLI